MTTIPSTSTVGTGASSVSNAIDNTEIASNFTTFLQLLTTQLKNQNPLDPLDTNQFTQQAWYRWKRALRQRPRSLMSAPRSWWTARQRS